MTTLPEFAGLAELRKRHARLSIATAARGAGLATDRLHAIEAGAPPSVFEIERLAGVYAVDPDALWDDPIRIADGDSVSLLTSLDEFSDVGDMTRARILRVALAARDLKRLRELLGVTHAPWHPAAPPRRLQPYQQGAELAERVRREMRLGVNTLPSVRDLVGEHFPWIALLYARLGAANSPAGLGFADSVRGPAIALNLDGKNSNALVRRFSLAHELAHLLVDWNQGEALASISGFLHDTSLDREQRANGFAARLLCPESVVQRLTKYRDEDAARVVIEDYGLHYAAARLYLHNEAQIHLPPEPPQSLERILSPAPAWVEAEAPRGVEDFPIADAPVERRGVLARSAAQAYASGVIARDAFARYLGLTPVHDLEEVLGYFDMDVPDPGATAGAA